MSRTTFDTNVQHDARAAGTYGLSALVRMANQIARQFSADSSLDAVKSTVAHLERFWEHEMRVDLARAVETGSITVDDVVVEAVRRLTVHA